MAAKKFIAKAISRPGALTEKVGGKPSDHMDKVRQMAAGGGLKAKQAQFFLNVLDKHMNGGK